MSTQQIAETALTLPPLERMRMALRLIDSVYDRPSDEALEVAVQRSQELASGFAIPVPYEVVMEKFWKVVQ